MHDRYVNALCTRYAGRTMQHIYSDDNKFSTWRRLWVALAESEQELGLPITDEQIRELRAHITDIDYDYAAAREHEVRHDVMAHVLTYGACCPEAWPSAPQRRHRRRQYGYHPHARSARADPQPAGERHPGARGLCRGAQGRADARLHAFSGRAADDRRQACHALDAGSADGSRAAGVSARQSQAPRLQGHDRHGRELPRPV